MNKNRDYLIKSEELISLALREDIGEGDITTNAIVDGHYLINAKIISKENGVICGIEVAKKVFDLLGGKVKWKEKAKEGEEIKSGEIIAELNGEIKTILSGERTALNFIQRMSGIATRTRNFVSQLKGTGTKLLDTRKTAPGMRYLDKYAVKVGGGNNHRMGLYDMILIKENHIRAADSITQAIKRVREKYGDKFKIEVEVRTFEEAKEAMGEKSDIIMLDNMNLSQIKNVLSFLKGKVLTEVSGNVNLANIREIALTGVDFISVGELTHSVKALDVSLLFE